MLLCNLWRLNSSVQKQQQLTTEWTIEESVVDSREGQETVLTPQRQVGRLFPRQLSTECDIELAVSSSSIIFYLRSSSNCLRLLHLPVPTFFQ